MKKGPRMAKFIKTAVIYDVIGFSKKSFAILFHVQPLCSCSSYELSFLSDNLLPTKSEKEKEGGASSLQKLVKKSVVKH